MQNVGDYYEFREKNKKIMTLYDLPVSTSQVPYDEPLYQIVVLLD